jgi:hypothetical protein
VALTTEIQTLELIGDHQLIVQRSPTNNVLKLVGSGGHLCFTICITPDGPVLRFDGPGLLLESSGDLSVNANRIAIHGREEVAITSGGDACIRVAGNLSSEGRVQDITARLGSVNVMANDDVKLKGERIRLNC